VVVRDALDLFRQALQVRPNYSNARFNLATSLAEGKLEEAAEHFRLILRAVPDDRGRATDGGADRDRWGCHIGGQAGGRRESYRELVSRTGNADLRNTSERSWRARAMLWAPSQTRGGAEDRSFPSVRSAELERMR
jgi:tetratricopeptide (TPR) repeat protein